jgi:N-acetylmuramoyl-L-alanine amidase
MPDQPAFSHGRRAALKAAAAGLTLLVTRVGFAAETAGAGASSLIAVRVWPADEYTRVTLEDKAPLKYSHLMLRNPDRLVVDLEGVEFDSVLASLPGKIEDSDPYIKLIRAGRFKPGVVRIVVELKSEVLPQVFTLPPVADYGYRLVLDLYPLEAADPLTALLDKRATSAPGKAPEATAAQADRPQDAKPSADRGAEPPAQPDIARLVTIAIDPGHGGEDPGARGRHGSREKNVTLAIARRLKAKIDAEQNMRSFLTRDGDYFIRLDRRVQKAQKARADLFVSIHADAFVKSTARGSSVFVLSQHGATSKAARLLAQKENSSDLIGGVNLNGKDIYLKRTLIDLSQTATINDSLKVGRAVLGELGDINALHQGRVEQAGFAVLKAPDIPSILVETAFISNPDEEQRLNDESYQERLAEAILRGIRAYFARNPPQPKSKMARLG